MTERFRELDGLRGLAAVAVVLSHLTTGYDSKYPDAPRTPFDAGWGAYGVQLFFMISGFVILMTAQRARRPSDFVVSRLSRLYPAYWIALTMSIVLSVTFAVPHTDIGWTNRLLNYVMVQRWFLVPNVDEVYWTLAIEMQFYVLMFLLLVATRCRVTPRVVAWASGVWVAVALAVAVWAGPASRGINPQYVDTPVKVVLNVVLAEWAPLFAAGMLAYLARSDRRFWLPAVGTGLLGALAAGILHDWAQAAIVAGVVLGFFAVASRRTTPVLLLPPLQWYGKISYSLYIGHLIPSTIAMHLLIPLVGRWAAMGITFVVVTLIAWGLHRLGEDYLSRRFKNVLKGWQKTVTAR